MKLTVRVASVFMEAEDVKTLLLVPAADVALPSFDAGAHVDVHLPNGLVRQYSLCNAPGESGGYRIAVKREPASRGGSQAVHDLLVPGTLLTVSAPRNNFPLAEDEAHCLLIAGGIGITPIIAMAERLLADGKRFALHYFSRGIRETAFHARLSEPRFRGKVSFHYALAPEAVRATLRKLLWERPDGAGLYLCGPRPFMDVVAEIAAATWPPSRVHVEYFSADPSSLSAPRPPLRVRLARHGGEFEVPVDATIVGALAKAGVTIETSCEQGVCGTCLTGVLEGIPDHRDVFLTDEEKAANDRFCPCVSRAKSELLVLDL